MNRRREDLQNLDTSIWPTVDSSALAAAKRKAFEERQEAINLYGTVNLPQAFGFCKLAGWQIHSSTTASVTLLRSSATSFGCTSDFR